MASSSSVHVLVESSGDEQPAGGTMVTCAICMEDVRENDCAEVTACGHRFCVICIERWAESCSKCPLCKVEMKALAQAAASSEQKDRPAERAVPKKRLRLPEEAEEELPQFDDIFCEACGGGHEEALLLLCDSCDAAHHTFCLSPPLASVPLGAWRCPQCAPQHRQRPRARGRPPGRASFICRGAASALCGADSDVAALPAPPAGGTLRPASVPSAPGALCSSVACAASPVRKRLRRLR
uniref:RING-type domain-containing protein n=1 Tax=Alexandrium catenella TaxID=2925 RepID=A0A7S1REY7_ALECA